MVVFIRPILIQRRISLIILPEIKSQATVLHDKYVLTFITHLSYQAFHNREDLSKKYEITYRTFNS